MGLDDGVQVAVEASGSVPAVSTAICALGIGGVAVLVGSVHPVGKVSVDPEAVVRGLKTIRGVHNYTPRHLIDAVAFLEVRHGAYPFAQLVSTSFPLAELDAAIAEAAAGSHLRVGISRSTRSCSLDRRARCALQHAAPFDTPSGPARNVRAGWKTGGMNPTLRFEMLTSPPSLEEYLGLRGEAGLSQKTPEQAAGALSGSWFFCHIREASTGQAVAMGRVIGDGGWCFHIADMATAPEFQGRGLGRRVIDTLVAHIRAHAPDNPYITLIADPPGRRLYEGAGFSEINPSRGMELPWERP